MLTAMRRYAVAWLVTGLRWMWGDAFPTSQPGILEKVRLWRERHDR